MSDSTKWARIALIMVMVALFGYFTFNIGRNEALEDAKYTLKTYTGAGHGVFRHGTIVKVVDGNPIIVGYLSNNSKDYPGTVEIKEVK